MAPPKEPPTKTKWTADFDTIRREKLFRNPPKDHTAYPALVAAVQPHIESFNALLDNSKLLEAALRDIGTKVFLDGTPETAEQQAERTKQGTAPERRNRLSVRIREVFLEKAVLPASNKFSTRNREIYPAECRERHATYRGRLRARVEYRVNNGDWKETVRELGQVPIMLKVSSFKDLQYQDIDIRSTSQTVVILRGARLLNWYNKKRSRRSWAATSL